MKKALIDLLDISNKSMHGNLINVDIIEYVDKLFSLAVINSYITEGELVGFCAYYLNDKVSKTSFLSMICVNPAYQGKGIGLILITQWIISAKYHGFIAFKLEVDIYNKKAVNIYEKMGFKECEKKEHSLIMICDLKNLNIRLP